MAGTPFPYPKSSTPGSRDGEGEGRYMNCAPVTEGERSYVRPVSGLALLVHTDKIGIRGLLDVDGVIYVVWTGSVVTVTGTSVATLIGSIPGSDGVTLARNKRVTGGVATPDVVAVRESGGAFLLTSSTVSAYPDADLPATANSVVFLDGFLLFSIPDGRMFASELNSTDVNALSFATAEARADDLRRIIVRGDIAYAMGGTTIEPWKNEGLSPFPLLRQATVMQVGLLTTMAAAGFEDSWNAPTYFASADGRVMALVGFEVAAASTPDVDRFIAASTPSAIEVAAFVYKGRSFIAVSSDIGSWVLDVEGRNWHERSSTGTNRWRVKCSAPSGDRWVFGDVLSGDLLVMSDGLTENGAALGGFIQSGQMKDFPAHIAAKLQAEFTKANVPVFVSWSRDGGENWSVELEKSLAFGEISVASLGRSGPQGLIVKFRWEGGADFSFMGATATRADARAA